MLTIFATLTDSITENNVNKKDAAKLPIFKSIRGSTEDLHIIVLINDEAP